MAFQFQCPQEHLLEGEESQAGQTINCPVCGMLFIIPEPIAAPAPEAAPEPQVPAEPELLHIACPNGHELEVPPEMLDTEVLCPQCNAQFRLRAKDSVEHRRRREEQEKLQDAKTNQFWFKFSIGIAVVVVLLLLSLMIMSALNNSRPEEPPPKKKSKSKSVPVKPLEETEGDPVEDPAAEPIESSTSSDAEMTKE